MIESSIMNSIIKLWFKKEPPEADSYMLIKGFLKAVIPVSRIRVKVIIYKDNKTYEHTCSFVSVIY